MKKNNPSHNVSSCSNSFLDSTPPKNLSIKHSDLTPLKKRNKTSKCKKDEDVHSTSSSTPPPPLLSGNEASPACTFVYPYSPYSSSCSEDSAPEVIWDYTSPKHPSGVARPERKMTIEDFLNNINFKVPSKKSESNYDKFMREWTLTDSDCVTPKQQKKSVRKPKRSAQRFEEMLKLLESFTSEDCISGAKQDKTVASQKEVLEADATVVSSKELNKPTEAYKAKDAALKDSCIEELWGDVSEDECFVKATQFLEENETDGAKHSDVTAIESRKIYADLNNRSVVVKTLPVSEKHMKFSYNENNPGAFKCHSDSKDNLDVFKQNSYSVIPNDSFGSWEKSEINNLTFMKPLDSKNISMQNSMSIMTPVYSGNIEFRDNKKIGSSVNHNDDLIKPDQGTTIHKRKDCVGNNSDFGSDSFHDDAILFQPETLLLLDKIESEVSARQKCSAEEIAKKKQEAMKRRKQSQQRKEVHSVKEK